MKVSLVILNWNGAELLKKYLPSIIKYAQPSNTEIIVADNASTDDSMEIMQKFFPEIKTIALDQNYGFAQGYNKALQQIDADWFILCNSDIEMKSDAITPMIDLLVSTPMAAAAMPKIKSLQQPQMFEYAGAAGGYIDKFGYPFCRGRILQNVEKDNNQYDDNRQIFWASGAFMAVNAEVYKKCSGLDADFFAHMEEIDFCWRVKNMGYKILYCGSAEVYHLGGATLNQENPRKAYLNYRNSLKTMYKNLSPKKLVPTIFFRMILDGISAIIYLMQLKISFFLAVFNAHIDFYKNLPTLHKKRKLLKKQTLNYNHKEIYNKSIVFQCLIKKQTKFIDF